jgi:hypothetical protein
MAFIPTFYDGHTGATIADDKFSLGQYVGLKFAGLLDPLDTVNMLITWSDSSVSPINMTAGIANFFSSTAQGWFLFSMPAVKTTGKVLLTVHTPIGSVTEPEIDIGVGVVAPVPGKPVNWYVVGGLAFAGALGVGLVARKLIK